MMKLEITIMLITLCPVDSPIYSEYECHTKPYFYSIDKEDMSHQAWRHCQRIVQDPTNPKELRKKWMINPNYRIHSWTCDSMKVTKKELGIP